jgi:hypothetical protein
MRKKSDEDPDPYQFEKPDSDAASKSKQATDSHQSEKPDLNPHQPGAVKAHPEP